MKSNWWESLNRYVDSCRGRSIDWDTFDCCQFICEAVKSMTGIDPYKEFKIEYHNKQGAIDAIAKYSGTSDFNKGIYKIITKIGVQTGGRHVTGSTARGDIVIIQAGSEYVCGVCMGSHIALVHETKGLILYSRQKCVVKAIIRYS